MSSKQLNRSFPFIHSFLIFLLFFLVGASAAFTQQNKKIQRFTIVHLPRNTGYSKVKLNQEIEKTKDMEEVQRIIQLKNFRPATIIICVNDDTARSWWTYRTSEDRSSSAKKLSSLFNLQSKAIITPRVTKLYDFKLLFGDTLAIIDSLEIEYAVRDEKYTPEGFQLQTRCDSKTVPIPSRNGKLVFSPALLAGCSGKIQYISINHSNNPVRNLSSGYITFLSDDEKESLLEIARFETSLDPSLPLNNIADRVANYAAYSIGVMYFPQLVDWLNQNLSKKSDGNHL